MSVTYQFIDAGFQYDSGFSLSGINIHINSNSITALVGSNGSGKTSMLNLLAFLALPTSGNLRFSGEILKKSNIKQLQRRVGYVQQNPYLIRGNVKKNVELGLRFQYIDKPERDKRVAAMLDRLNITDLSDRNVNGLSGGESQKVAIAQALVLQPEVLILDEPFTFLDERSIRELEQLIVRLKQDMQKTIVLTTHNQVQSQLLADHMLSIVNGRIFAATGLNVLQGTMQDKSIFDTGKIKIQLPEGTQTISQIAVDPNQIVLSKSALDSSMQNNFSGRVISISQEFDNIKVVIRAEEEFKLIVTPQAMSKLAISIGDMVWIGFKSSSILLC